MGMIRVLLADDHAIVRAGLRAVLEEAADIEVVDEVATTREAVAACATRTVDVVLMDLRFGADQGSGVEGTAALRALPAPPRVLVVTNYDTDADILGAIEAGAAGYLLKDAAPEVLIDGIRRAAAGESALSPSVATRLLSRARRPASALSVREVEVLALVAEGLSNRELARRLFLSEATVKSHLANIFGKLGVRSRTSAVARAREEGII